jgi:hypothetical protein
VEGGKRLTRAIRSKMASQWSFLKSWHERSGLSWTSFHRYQAFLNLLSYKCLDKKYSWLKSQLFPLRLVFVACGKSRRTVQIPIHFFLFMKERVPHARPFHC